jgi:hypothetical protein
MGTPGLIKLVCKEKTIYVYNHFDSYPSGLGVSLIAQIKNILATHGKEWLITKISALIVVDENDVPDQMIINKLAKYTDLTVSNQNVNDW